jgi:hypothetical protein
MRTELLPNGHVWFRIARAEWDDPLDPSFAAEHGGRWNPPRSHLTLYLNEDRATARCNVRTFIEGWPYEPEDLCEDTGPVLVLATLPTRQEAADAHSPAGVAAVGLPPTYPLDASGELVQHSVCQPIGRRAHAAGLRGVRARSARAPEEAGRELAWFPASRRSRATQVRTESFRSWYWR